MNIKYLLSASIVALALSGCNDDDDKVATIDTSLNTQILADFSNDVASATYTELQAKAVLLNTQVATLKASKTDANLAACQQTWKDARLVWEQTEAHLFGPVATEDIDPRIDTWPVNFTDLDEQLAGSHPFDESYIDGLDDALKGFHPIEYLIFGQGGTKKAADITARQMEYLEALSLNLKKLTTELGDNWSASNASGNYISVVSNAGAGSAEYKTQLAAFEELVNAMAGICDEVANGKLAEPYEAQNPSLEESPFAANSIIDFTNNIKGVQNVYLGKYKTDGKGLEDLVRAHNLSLDTEIKTKLNAAINSLNNITTPFGQAITDRSPKVQNAMDAINDLKSVLEEDLLVFVAQHSN